ncbi:DUF748 domain-containing protein [Pseudoduganella violacea]|uniref:DUF748 domain-containing protein n=1 Tax=Pseudoduganella violacea TaxID=1715466 RepID=A0A7W5B903_9BURK|nr:DUF748 domain-containing protein [Pseudoduganella violacea]MBB3118767.1 hypothetical protein [Pseudoduganella violacea]
MKNKWLKRALRAVLVLAGLVLLYAALGFLALPALIKSQAQQKAADILHRQLTIEKVELNPFTLALTVHGLKMMEPQGDAVFASFDRLAVDLSGQSLLRLAPVVQEVRLSKPYVHLVRKDANHYSIDDIIELIASQPPSPEPARFSVNNIQIEEGGIAFEDKPAGSSHKIEGLKLGIPFVSSMPTDVQLFVEPLFSAVVNGAPLHLNGKLRPFADTKEVVFELKLDNLDVPRYLAYLPTKLAFRMPSGRLDAQLHASFRQPKEGGPALVLGGEAKAQSVELTQADGKPALKAKELVAKLGKIDVFGGRFDFESLIVDGLEANVVSDGKGQLNVARMFAPEQPQPLAPASTKVPAKAEKNSSGSHYALKTLEFRNTTLRYTHEAPHEPMRVAVDKFALALRDIAVETGKQTVSIGEIVSDSAGIDVNFDKPRAAAPAPQPKSAAPKDEGSYVLTIARLGIDNWTTRLVDNAHAKPLQIAVAPLSLDLQDISTAPGSRIKVDLKTTVNNDGRLALNGSFVLAPFSTELAVEVKDLGILPLQPYVTDYVNLRLVHADVSTKGKLLLETGSDGAMKGGFKGDASVTNLATVDKASSNDFLRWKALTFGGVDVRLQPFALNIDKVGLSDFFARIIIDPSGRINVQDIMRDKDGEAKSLTEADPSSHTKAKANAPKTPAVAEAKPVRKEAAQPLPPVRVGKLVLSGGRVRFTDNFIKPNYTANLNDLGGTVSGLSSDANSSANVDLRGVVNNAPLVIGGRVNPLKRDLSLDVKAEVRGIELASLSAYSDKYVGYGIEKGKMSFEVGYNIENRQLKSSNRLILEQLTFGRENSNPDVTKLPVGLAVALLSDRNGVIDINVPIGGSIDDPEFSIGGIILKIIGNAIVKTVTAPFTLISSLFGGGSAEELSMLAFDPGRAQIPAAGEEKLKPLARALGERPGLKLEITGRYDPAMDMEALKLLSIDRKLRALKAKDMQARGEVLPDSVTVKAEERLALLTRAYKEEKFDKPRNALGLQKSLPQAEMERLMLSHTKVEEEDLVALGNRRAQAAKDWLTKTGQVPAERLFIVAAKAVQKDAGGEKAQSTRVDFSLR